MTESTDDELPPIAQVAWEAYQRMSATKNTYYEFLNIIRECYDQIEERLIV